MSQYAGQYEEFFTSPAGLSFLTWLREQRTTEHEKAENAPKLAAYHSMKAAAYGEILEHIDSVMIPISKSPYSSGAGEGIPQQIPNTPSTGLGTSQVNER